METLIKTSTLVLTRVGEHHMDGGLYRAENGDYYVDLHNEPEDGEVATLYRLSPANEPDGEPDRKVFCTVEFTNPLSEREKRERMYKKDYMMLSRMQTDCNYYSTASSYNHAHWSTIEQTIQEMKRIWQSFPEDLKPEWCTWEQILGYEKKFLS